MRHREAGVAGQFVAWAIIAVGFFVLVRGEGGILLMITGLFILVNAKVEIAGAAMGERLDGITVGDLTWYGVAHAGPDMDADSMLWQRRRLGAAGGVAVTDDAGSLQGLAFEDEMWNIPADQRPWVMLTQMMVPFDRLAKASADESLFSVLRDSTPVDLRSRCGATAVWSAWFRRPRCANGSHGGAELGPVAQASATDHLRLATGGLSLQGKLIHMSVRRQT